MARKSLSPVIQATGKTDFEDTSRMVRNNFQKVYTIPEIKASLTTGRWHGPGSSRGEPTSKPAKYPAFSGIKVQLLLWY